MTRFLALPLLLAACSSVPPPVCAQAEVLQLLGERLARAGQGQYIEAASVNQRPTDRPGVVQCAVRVQTATYDMNRFGTAPAVTVGIVNYAVEMRRNGVFLLPDQAGGQAGVATRSM